MFGLTLVGYGGQSSLLSQSNKLIADNVGLNVKADFRYRFRQINRLNSAPKRLTHCQQTTRAVQIQTLWSAIKPAKLAYSTKVSYFIMPYGISCVHRLYGAHHSRLRPNQTLIS